MTVFYVFSEYKNSALNLDLGLDEKIFAYNKYKSSHNMQFLLLNNFMQSNSFVDFHH